MTQSDFAAALFTYCALTRASVTSSIRTRAHNQRVGGVTYSAHLAGLAADVIYDDPDEPYQRGEIALRLGLRRIVEADHDHLQPVSWQPG